MYTSCRLLKWSTVSWTTLYRLNFVIREHNSALYTVNFFAIEVKGQRSNVPIFYLTYLTN